MEVIKPVFGQMVTLYGKKILILRESGPESIYVINVRTKIIGHLVGIQIESTKFIKMEYGQEDASVRSVLGDRTLRYNIVLSVPYNSVNFLS